VMEQREVSPGGITLGNLGPVSEGFWVWIVGIGGVIGIAVWVGARSSCVLIAPLGSWPTERVTAPSGTWRGASGTPGCPHARLGWPTVTRKGPSQWSPHPAP